MRISKTYCLIKRLPSSEFITATGEGYEGITLEWPNIPNELSQRTLIPSDTTGTMHLAEVMGDKFKYFAIIEVRNCELLGSRRPRISHGEELRASFGEMI
ncbi:hypothetical protein CEXT_322541 [Caerostris extrusa]|uniref:Uncharacterized protein n=1 Tax=Caerostris extrusa TaxID=172846 RepID=A0AAV4W5G7_CAEEX|nr:hypothetical protein CEXT_322541 [Caerostris extrusa]